MAVQELRPQKLIDQTVKGIYRCLLESFPGFAKSKISGVEFWAHSRDGDGAHQLHFDTDERQFAERGPLSHPVRHFRSYCSELISSDGL